MTASVATTTEPGLGLGTGDPDIRTFDLEAPKPVCNLNSTPPLVHSVKSALHLEVCQ
jgi:hypothetical protein